VNTDDLEFVAPLFKALHTPSPGAQPTYDMITDSLVWSDELPDAQPNLWWAIRPVLHHRTCIILQRASTAGSWWNRAIELFPEWVGFLPTRQTPTEDLRALYLSAVKIAEESMDRHFGGPSRDK